MKELLKSNARNFFFDIEDTVLAENVFYSVLGQNSFRNILTNLCAKVDNFYHITSFGKNYKRHLLDSQLPSILKKLRSHKKRIFSITSGFLSFAKINRLRELNINFEYIIFTKKIDKGPVLIEFLDKYHLKGPCAFIDNDLYKIHNVREHYYNRYGKNIESFLFKKDCNHNITQQEFIDYWQEVIEAYKHRDKK